MGLRGSEGFRGSSDSRRFMGSRRFKGFGGGGGGGSKREVHTRPPRPGEKSGTGRFSCIF